MAADKYLCLACDPPKPVAITASGAYRKHVNDGYVCVASGTKVSQVQLDKGPIADDEKADVPVEGRDFAACGECGRQVIKLTPEGNLKQHTKVAGARWVPDLICPGKDPAVASPVPTKDSASGPSNGDEIDSSKNRYDMRSEELPRIWQPEVVDGRPVTDLELPPSSSGTYPQPLTPQESLTYSQPWPPETVPAPSVEMTPLGERLKAKYRQLFFHYNNRKTDDNRSAQTTLGPSQIGTPCDRRLVMSLLDVRKCHPGGDGWAAWLGTQGHSGLAEMFEWADAGTGSFAVETRLEFPSELVPYGTGDLLDRSEATFVDHKFMGWNSLKRLRSHGPSSLYRWQVHTYGYGAALRGEQIKHVAIAGWPREGSSLDDLYIWTEPFDPTVGIEALARVQRLADWARDLPADEAVKQAAVRKDCSYCPFFKPNTRQSGLDGCNGKP